MTNHQITAFPLSLAIVDSNAQSPVLFLHLSINPGNKKAKGESELMIPSGSSCKTELIGDYQNLRMVYGEDGHVLKLLGYPLYDQVCPSIKITLVTDRNWMKPRVFYEYLQDGQWLKMHNFNLKIKLDHTAIALSNLHE